MYLLSIYLGEVGGGVEWGPFLYVFFKGIYSIIAGRSSAGEPITLPGIVLCPISFRIKDLQLMIGYARVWVYFFLHPGPVVRLTGSGPITLPVIDLCPISFRIKDLQLMIGYAKVWGDFHHPVSWRLAKLEIFREKNEEKKILIAVNVKI